MPGTHNSIQQRVTLENEQQSQPQHPPYVRSSKTPIRSYNSVSWIHFTLYDSQPPSGAEVLARRLIGTRTILSSLKNTSHPYHVSHYRFCIRLAVEGHTRPQICGQVSKDHIVELTQELGSCPNTIGLENLGVWSVIEEQTSVFSHNDFLLEGMRLIVLANRSMNRVMEVTLLDFAKSLTRSVWHLLVMRQFSHY